MVQATNKRGFVQGFFKPKHPEKYLGNPNRIIFRSSYELNVFKKFDSEPSFLTWGSELFSIPYLSPVDGKVHQYFPDLLVMYRDSSNNIRKMLIEIKPYHSFEFEDHEMLKKLKKKKDKENE